MNENVEKRAEGWRGGYGSSSPRIRTFFTWVYRFKGWLRSVYIMVQLAMMDLSLEDRNCEVGVLVHLRCFFDWSLEFAFVFLFLEFESFDTLVVGQAFRFCGTTFRETASRIRLA